MIQQGCELLGLLVRHALLAIMSTALLVYGLREGYLSGESVLSPQIKLTYILNAASTVCHAPHLQLYAKFFPESWGIAVVL